MMSYDSGNATVILPAVLISDAEAKQRRTAQVLCFGQPFSARIEP